MKGEVRTAVPELPLIIAAKDIPLTCTCIRTYTDAPCEHHQRNTQPLRYAALSSVAGNNAPIDFFVGQLSGSSVIQLQDVQRLRLACASGPDSATVVDYTPRSQLLPNPYKKQVFHVTDITWHVSLPYSTGVASPLL